jgi:hypothetical protein
MRIAIIEKYYSPGGKAGVFYRNFAGGISVKICYIDGSSQLRELFIDNPDDVKNISEALKAIIYNEKI